MDFHLFPRHEITFCVCISHADRAEVRDKHLFSLNILRFMSTLTTRINLRFKPNSRRVVLQKCEACGSSTASCAEWERLHRAGSNGIRAGSSASACDWNRMAAAVALHCDRYFLSRADRHRLAIYLAREQAKRMTHCQTQKRLTAFCGR